MDNNTESSNSGKGYLNRLIQVIYSNPGITTSELAELFETSISSISNITKRYISIEPPLFTKEKHGKEVSHTLTADGENYYFEKIYNNEKYKSSNCFIQFIEKIHDYPGIKHKDLADKLNTTANSLSNRVNRYKNMEPPLFIKVESGRCSTYQLTIDGENFYSEKIDKINDKDRISKSSTNAKNIEIEQEMKKVLIEYTLMNCDHSSNPYSHILKGMDVAAISKVFSTGEFLYLSMSLGILKDEFYGLYNSYISKYASKDADREEVSQWEQNVNNKFKKLIIKDMDDNMSIQSNSSNKHPCKKKISKEG